MHTPINWLRLSSVQFWLILQIYQTLENLLKTHQKMCPGQLDRQLCRQELDHKTDPHMLPAMFFQLRRLPPVLMRLIQLLRAMFLQLRRLLLLLMHLTQLLRQLRRQRLHLETNPHTPSTIFFQLRRLFLLLIRLTQLLRQLRRQGLHLETNLHTLSAMFFQPGDFFLS